MLVKVRCQDWNATFAYAPPLVDALVNTAEVVTAVTVESRGEGPFTRVNLKNGTSMVIHGTPDQLLPGFLTPEMQAKLARLERGVAEWADDPPPRTPDPAPGP